jgi:hypothetical protein
MAEHELGRASTRPVARARRSLVRFVVAASALVAASVGLVVAGSTEAGAVAPTVTVVPSTTSPGQFVQVSGSNWPANTTAFISVDGTDFCNPTSNGSGSIPPTACQVPGVPAGNQNLVAEMNNNAQTATTTLKITPAITYLPNGSFSPGTTFSLNSGGFAGGSVVHAYLDSTSSTALTTSPVTPTTDTSGTLNSLSVTLPTTATAGAHTLILQDGSSNKASRSMTIYKPTFTVGATSGVVGTSIRVTGSGWRPNDSVQVYMGATNFCAVAADASGAFAAACNVPAVPAGAHPTSAAQDSNDITATGPSFSVGPAVTSFPDPAVSPGATVRVDVEGLAASSNVSALLGTTALVTNPAHPTTDSNGTMSDLMVTFPSTAKSGTLTVKDSSGNSATTKVSVYKPKVTLGATSASPSSNIPVTGKGLWPNQPVYLYYGSTYFCQLTVNASGTVNGSCTAPTAPAGPVALSAQQDNGAISKSAGTLTIVPAITYLPNSVVTGGASIRVDTYGLAATHAVTATLTGVTGHLATNPPSPVTDASGSIPDLMVTIPATVAAGSPTLTISDGTHSASEPITVLAPTVSFSASSGAPGTSFAMTGSGWDPSPGSAYIYFGTTYECSATVDSSGDLYGSCTVPSLSVGSYPITLQQDSGAVDVANGNFTIT